MTGPTRTGDGPVDRQRLHADRAYAQTARPVYEGNHYHDYFRAIPFAKLARLLRAAGVDLAGRSVLVGGCGNGVDLHYLRRYYTCRWHVTDVSAEGVRLAQAAFPGVEGRAADLQRLPFDDCSFDYAYVASALHHLPEPWRGFYELYRVARRGVILIEPNDSWLTRLATRAGFATEVEPAGNYVFRFGRHDIARAARALFTEYHCRRFFACHRVATGAVEFRALQAANALMNLVAPALGNVLVAVVHRPERGSARRQTGLWRDNVFRHLNP